MALDRAALLVLGTLFTAWTPGVARAATPDGGAPGAPPTSSAPGGSDAPPNASGDNAASPPAPAVTVAVGNADVGNRDAVPGATPPAPPAPADKIDISHPHFGEEGGPAKPGWSVLFHGYARMPLRLYGDLTKARKPRLVDDNYGGGFSYLRFEEGEWAEIYLSIEKEMTRFVFGLMSGQYSDWSQASIQPGIALAFVEQGWKLGETGELGLRAGMFWDRYSYFNVYDTYMFSRFHVAGARLKLRLMDRWYTQLGVGANADNLTANQGLTPVAWLTTGVDLGWLDLALFGATSWTRDSEHEKAAIHNGSMEELGAEARVAIPGVGPLWTAVAAYHLSTAQNVGPAIEVLHSAGGAGLVQNYLGPNSTGSGDITAGAVNLGWEPRRTVSAIAGRTDDTLRGLKVNLFGMIASVNNVKPAGAASVDDYNNRVYLKWGLEPVYRPPFDGWSKLFASLRYDHVDLFLGNGSRTYDVLTPRIGLSPVSDTFFDIFLQYAFYSYGSGIQLPAGKYPADPNVTMPDTSSFKLQAQIGF